MLKVFTIMVVVPIPRSPGETVRRREKNAYG